MQIDLRKYYFRVHARTSLSYVLCVFSFKWQRNHRSRTSRFLWKAARTADSTSTVSDLLLIIVPRVESGKTTKRAECPARETCTRKALTREPCREACIKSPPTLMDAKSDLKPTHRAPAWSSLWYIDIRITNGVPGDLAPVKKKSAEGQVTFLHTLRDFLPRSLALSWWLGAPKRRENILRSA